MPFDVGVLLPTIGHLGNDLPDLRAVARHAEAVGLGSVWAGDHLTMGGAPLLESMLALGAAAAVTERVRIGCSVTLAAMRPLAWMAKQVATLQYLSGNRFEFGVGVGAKWAEEWAASGVPLTERGRRTDELLQALPGLLAGEPTKLPGVPGEPEVTMRPEVPLPPIWVGGRSERAMRRAATYCTGWLTTITTPEEIRKGAMRLGEFADAAGRPVPKVGTMIYASITAGHSADATEVIATRLANGYALPIEHTRQVVVGGSPAQTAEGLAGYRDAGVEQVVVALEGTGWQAQYERLAEAARLMGP